MGLGPQGCARLESAVVHLSGVANVLRGVQNPELEGGPNRGDAKRLVAGFSVVCCSLLFGPKMCRGVNSRRSFRNLGPGDIEYRALWVCPK